MNFNLLKERPPLLKASTQSMVLSRRKSFLNEIITVVQTEEIPPELVLNFDKNSTVVIMDNGQGGQ